MKSEIKSGMLILVCTLLICFVISESFARFFYGRHLQYRIDEELYWELLPNQYGYQDLGFPFATINSDGFRGEELSKDLSKIRLLMLGCSYTFGQAIADHETFPFQLQKLLGNSYEVINAASPGWGLFQELERFKRVEPVYKPKFVVVTLINHTPFRQPFSLKSDKEAYLKRMKIRAFFMKSALSSFLFDLVKKAFGSNFGATGNYLERGKKDNILENLWQEDKKRLLEIKKIADKKGIKLILVGYTRLGNYDDSFLKLVKDFEKETGVPSITNLNEIFSKYSKEDLEAKNDGHPSGLANKEVADQLFKLIKKLEK